MNLGVRFRVLAAGNVLPPASHPGFAGKQRIQLRLKSAGVSRTAGFGKAEDQNEGNGRSLGGSKNE